jgi:hypothetical protein
MFDKFEIKSFFYKYNLQVKNNNCYLHKLVNLLSCKYKKTLQNYSRNTLIFYVFTPIFSFIYISISVVLASTNKIRKKKN